jgi:DNA mismatch repair protein MutS
LQIKVDVAPGTMNPPKLTPMIRQYLSIKEQHQDAILFYRMGDFYEMFFKDAEIASQVLEIALTSRNKKESSPVPMCGVPYRAAKNYINRLIEKGYKVAICDQVEDPAQAKGLVKREVVRVITPGMIVENEYLDEKSDNYILSIAYHDGIVGLAYLDLSTGQFRVTESNRQHSVLDEIRRISPCEILLPDVAESDSLFSEWLSALDSIAISYQEAASFDLGQGRQRLLQLFHTRSLEGFGCEALQVSLGAAGALLQYVQETQKQKIEHITKIEAYTLDSYLVLDDLSCRNLELLRNLRSGNRKGTLIGVLDKTKTPMGGRLLKRWLRYPLRAVDEILARLDAVEEAKENHHIRESIRQQLQSIYDLERLGSKISMGHANARDLLFLKQSLQGLPSIVTTLAQLDAKLYRWRGSEDSLWAQLKELSDLLDDAIREDAPHTVTEGGIIRGGFHQELDELIEISRDGKGWLIGLEADEKSKTGINSLKVRYNKVFGYYIEVPKSQSELVPDHYVRKQTLVNAERYITDELKHFETKVLGAEEKRAALEYELFNQLREAVIRQNTSIQETAQFVAVIDCLLNLAEIAAQYDYKRPELNTDGRILIEDGRHPVIEKMIAGERFVPNTIRLDDTERQVLIITGPNMAGKSTILRQVALLVLMAHFGCFVPAKSASINLTDRIFTRVGALDNLSQGQSTFMVEMEETANILNNASGSSLVIMDEIGRGTSTFDGLSIAWAVAEYLHDLNGKGVKTLFATHYHELTDLALTKKRVKNYNIAVKEWNDEIIFLRKLAVGGTNRSYGIQVARLAGVPESVIKRSKKILSNIEKGELSISGTPSLALDEHVAPPGHRQLDLFPNPEQVIIEQIQKIDIATMTPIEALNYLNTLKEKAKGVIQ